MSHRQFSVGEGIIGEVALSGQHKWIFSENYENNLLNKLLEEWRRQFSAGIKTILLVPIANFGVLQFGSLYVVCEDHNLVEKIKDLFAWHVHFGEISSSEYLPINPYNQPSFTHSFNFPLVDDIHLHTFDHSAMNSVWDSLLVDPSEDLYIADESSIITNLPFTPQVGFHGVRFGCLEENSGLLFESSLDEIDSYLKKGTSTEVEQFFNPVTNFSESYLPENQIEGVQISTPFSSSEYFLGNKDSLSKNERNNMRNSGVPNQIQNRRKVRQDVLKRRPRDRQLVQKRINELRELIPDGSKCSIDALLERTVKHMLFLEAVSKQAEKIKQTEISNMKRVERDENRNNGQLSADMSASQKENRADIGTLIVEDLDQPGNILVEMLYMEYENFLDIANTIKGLHLPILKGVFENRSGELWAHFVIEVTKGFHRTRIVWPLMQLLQQSSLLQA